MVKGWNDFVCRSILPTTNRSELTVERAVLIHSIIIGENINVEEIIADQFYKFVYKTDLSSRLPFPSIIAALCLEAKGKHENKKDQRNPRQARQEALPQQQPPQEQPQPQVHHQQDFPPNFYTHFDNSMSMIYRRLDQQQEESRKSFEAINTRMDRMDDQLSFFGRLGPLEKLDVRPSSRLLRQPSKLEPVPEKSDNVRSENPQPMDSQYG
ncbi:hypothetical protein PIB30_096828 [Stylosanthes scabra]|uniref:Putative plant transposon protein domain-containing protein n=1 Tax=Stylosanthes scabra TaxID=79078 RepID=A0ABU6QXJ0_9FABA|nr:hypothetical protein [Stylosanthes scabra]